MMKLENVMARRMVKHTAAAQFRQFSPEADGAFPVVPEAKIVAWRDKLNAKYGIGVGKLKVVDDPFAAA